MLIIHVFGFGEFEGVDDPFVEVEGVDVGVGGRPEGLEGGGIMEGFGEF
jgi:hypothetical protein